AGSEKIDLNVLPRHSDRVAGQARALQLDTILAGLDVLSGARSRLQYSSHGRTLVEMGLIRLGRLGQVLSVGQLSQMLGQLASGGMTQAPATPPSPPASGSRPVAPPEGIKKNSLTPDPEAPTATAPPLSAETLPQTWAQVLTQVGGMLA